MLFVGQCCITLCNGMPAHTLYYLLVSSKNDPGSKGIDNDTGNKGTNRKVGQTVWGGVFGLGVLVWTNLT